jgi:hypothetical protein
MTFQMQSHGGAQAKRAPTEKPQLLEALRPADGDIAVDEAADFGFLLPPGGDASQYLPAVPDADLDQLGDLMVPDVDTVDATPDGAMAPVLTYWGQFLDHEMTARTDRESDLTGIDDPTPKATGQEIERQLKNARTPRFDLDSVYGGLPVGTFSDPSIQHAASVLRTGLRHPVHTAKMRVGTAVEPGPLPDDTLDPHRDLPRFHQVEQKVRDAALDIARAQMNDDAFAKFEAGLPKRALIGDMRNDENIIIAQFHLSFLRFHNKVVDFLTANDTGWIADFDAAKSLTKLHYQWLVVHGYLKDICDPAVVTRILDTRNAHYDAFRAGYAARNPGRVVGNVIPLEFSVAAFRFGHSMVRNIYDYNRTFGRPNGTAPFDQIFAFTGGGGIGARFGLNLNNIPKNWVIDWARFVTPDASFADGGPQRVARRVDTVIAPPLGDMANEGGEFDAGTPDGAALRALFRNLARRNLRRGKSLRLPTGQALHAHLQSIGAVTSGPQANVRAWIDNKPELTAFLDGHAFNSATPLWFYCLAEAEGTPGPGLGEMGSWIVAATFIGALMDDADSALSREFSPDQSPLRTPNGDPIDTIERWMRFAAVLA